jgi:5-methylcytosine-specific restriction endonuclease McrA
MGITQQSAAARKTCSMCNQEKELTNFSPRSKGKYGVAAKCKPCNAAASSQYRASNPERYRKLKREARLRNPQKMREENAARYRKNPEAEKARYKKYYETHKHEIVENGRRRRTRLLAAPTFKVTSREWNRLCSRYRNCCAYCGDKTRLTMDHVVPLIRGGYHGIGNLLPACPRCNSSKNKKFIVEWKALNGTH